MIGIQLEATFETTEAGLRLSVRLVAVPAPATGAARVPRINLQHRNTAHLRLVADELLQLIESPVAQQPAHCLRCRGSLPNARQVLQSECLLQLRGCLHNSLADRVVHVPYRPGLPTSDPPQTLLRRVRLLALKLTTMLGHPAARLLYLRARVSVPL